MSEWNPNDPAHGGPVPLLEEQPPEAGGTMVGVARVNVPAGGFGAPRFGAFAMPQPGVPQAPEAGGTMVGIARVGAGGAPAGFAAPPSFAPPEAGGTMVGMARVGAPAAPNFAPGFAPNFGGMAMQTPGQGPPEAGGTMVGMARVGAAGAPAAFAPPGFAPPPEAGGTMVGMSRVGAPMAQGFGAPQEPEAGGTMVGIPRGAIGGGFGFAPPPHPSGPPQAYEILAHLGGGELGQVFHARHRENGVEYALRIVRPDIAAVPGAVEALRDVVALAQNAIHTHLGRQLELDETASPTLVLEYVPGKQLAALMRERGTAPAPAVIDLGVRLCSALAAAHGAGLAHGRVHAGNVVLEAKTGRWVMLDLGHGYAMQALEPAHDLYALGALLYEMATGHSPFEIEGQTPDPRSWKPGLPAGLSALLLRTLAPDPAMWFGSAIELAQALARAKGQP